jgi:tRNA(Ile)-lysidine synthase TilS/MesJ
MKSKTEQQQLFHHINERFVKAFATYRLLEDDDHVLVGLSGGKDSLCLLELLAKRARISHPRFTVEALHVRMANISYETSTDYLQRFCDELGVKLHIVTTSFSAEPTAAAETAAETAAEVAAHDDAGQKSASRPKPPCFLCSWNRRKQLFNLAQQLGCNKIALGHHQDDLLTTALMNLTFQGRFGTMPARMAMRKMPLTIIRPLCLVAEEDIRRYAELSGYEKQLKQCPYEHDSHRTSIRTLYDTMERLNPEARFSLWNALCREGKLVEDALEPTEGG